MISESRAQRPLGITVIGIYMLFGACLMPSNIFAHAPAFLMGADFTGWAATVFFLALGALDAAIGIGLLRLATWSRIAAIYFFLFRIANTSLTFLVPGTRARFLAGIDLMRASMGRQSAPPSLIWYGLVMELFSMAFILWFLLTQTKAFPAAEGPAPTS